MELEATRDLLHHDIVTLKDGRVGTVLEDSVPIAMGIPVLIDEAVVEVPFLDIATMRDREWLDEWITIFAMSHRVREVMKMVVESRSRGTEPWIISRVLRMPTFEAREALEGLVSRGLVLRGVRNMGSLRATPVWVPTRLGAAVADRFTVPRKHRCR